MIGRIAMKYKGGDVRNATFPELISFLSGINPDIKSFSSMLYYRGTGNNFDWKNVHLVVRNDIITPIVKPLAYTENYIDFHLLSINPPLFYWKLFKN